MSRAAIVLSGENPFPPSVEDFYLPSLFGGAWGTKFTLMVWLAVALIIVFMLTAYRNPKIVPTRMQWIAESIYGFTRNGIAEEVIGHKGVKFAPYLTSLLLFIAVTNIFAIVPGLQISPNSHIAFPIVLAICTYVLYLWIGVRKHGLGHYLKMSLVPPNVPWPMLFLLVPLEFAQTFILRPFTLALRLFANMFAGHVVLLVFTLGGFALLGANSWAIKPVSLVSWAMAIALTFFEALIALLQAYVFVLLTSSYLESSLADEH
ncbi:F-type H+-transporting ATPase subunit a [Allocatelliglobosispora scoriae]|uniref:ATP synthase subunit a n=1 Tax=Allocatelliglobosispora scoriae TaxID=643052 RepID=A0A841BX15_9ACTN|nr:F0F1 ATP synthase subunit A [Allocatelliglobosispora scoriae]MBB5872038.1 F-type H+-transporting ATPase subunit a [Allocatelliglobosispora scoriae]